jgi:hypothetical protein
MLRNEVLLEAAFLRQSAYFTKQRKNYLGYLTMFDKVRILAFKNRKAFRLDDRESPGGDEE